MLVIARRIGETVRIGDAVIKVLSINGSRVKLGIEAPGHVSIMRGELSQPNTLPLPPDGGTGLRLLGAA